LPSGVTYIGSSAFYGCRSLALTSLPSGITSIGEQAFRESSLKLTNLPSGVTSIGEQAFFMCRVIALTLGANIVNISAAAFDSSNLKYILCESEAVAQLARYKGSDDIYIYSRQASGYAGGTSETSVKINDNLTIYTATVDGYKWVRNGSKYYKAIA